MKTIRMKLCALAVASLALVTNSNAALMGALVNVTAYYPDAGSVYDNGGDTSVSGAIEYGQGAFYTYNPSWEIDITDTQITIRDATSLGFPYAAGAFNGWVLTILSGPTIVSASADGASQFNPVGLSIVGGNQLFLNYSGVAGPAGGISIINIETVPVPEPSTYLAGALLALVFGVQGVRTLRNRKQTA